MSWITIAGMQCAHAVLLIQTMHLLKSDDEAWKRVSVFLLLEAFIAGIAFFSGKRGLLEYGGQYPVWNEQRDSENTGGGSRQRRIFSCKRHSIPAVFSMLLRRRLPFFWNYSFFPMAQWCVFCGKRERGKRRERSTRWGSGEAVQDKA